MSTKPSMIYRHRSTLIETLSSALRSERLGCVCASVALTMSLSVFGAVICWPLKMLTNVARSSQTYSENELFLQPLWSWLVNDWGSVTASAAFPALMSFSFYFLGAAPFCLLDWLDLECLRRFKLRGVSRPLSTYTDWYKTLMYQFNNITLYILPLVAWQILSKGPWMYSGPTLCFHSCDGKTLLPSKAPSLLEFAVHGILSALVFDALFFFWHKSHHEDRRLYKHIHTIHHQYHAPFVFVTQYAHPAEMLAASVFSLLVPIFMGAHPFSQWAWLIVSVQLSLDAHAGYELPISIGKILPFLGLGGAIHHDLHHQWPRTNFQPFFTWADLWCGTDYRFSPECKRASEKASEEPKKES